MCPFLKKAYLPGFSSEKLLFFTLYLVSTSMWTPAFHHSFPHSLQHQLILPPNIIVVVFNGFIFPSFLLHLLVGILQLGRAFSSLPFIHLFIHVMDYYFILWITYFFAQTVCNSGAPRSRLLYLFDMSPSLCECSLRFWRHKVSQAHLYFLCATSPGIGHFSREPQFFLLDKVFKNQILRTW